MIAMIPSIIALLAKLWLFYVASYSLATHNRPLAITILSLGLCNLIELWGFGFVGTQGSAIALVGLKYYYVFLLFSGLLLFRLSLELVMADVSRRINPLLLAFGFLICLPLSGNSYITDYQSIGYAITRVPGPSYGLLSASLVLAFALPASTLAYGAWIQKDKRCAALFFCSLPILVVLIFALTAMFMGYAVNAAGYMSMATTLFVLGIYFTESTQHRFALLSCIPGTEQKRTKGYLLELATLAATSPEKLKQVQADLDRFIAERCLEQSGGNISRAAETLGVSPRTFKRKCFEQDESDGPYPVQ